MEWFVWVRVLRLRSGYVSRIAALIFRRARVFLVTSCAETRFFLPSARQQGPPRLTQRGCRGKSARGEQANQSVQRFHPPNPGKITNNQPSPPNPEGHSVPGGRFCRRRVISPKPTTSFIKSLNHSTLPRQKHPPNSRHVRRLHPPKTKPPSQYHQTAPRPATIPISEGRNYTGRVKRHQKGRRA